MSDPAQAYAALRVETAQMLNLDLADLSLVAGLQLDLVSLLRLEVDTLQGRALANEPTDLDRLSTALGMLQKLLPAQALVSTPPPSETQRFGPDHQRRLRALVEATLLGPGAAERDARDERLLQLFHGVERGRNADELRRALEELIAAVLPVPAPTAAAPSDPPPAPPLATSSQPPLPRGEIPEHYLKRGQRYEEWFDPDSAHNVVPLR